MIFIRKAFDFAKPRFQKIKREGFYFQIDRDGIFLVVSRLTGGAEEDSAGGLKPEINERVVS